MFRSVNSRLIALGSLACAGLLLVGAFAFYQLAAFNQRLEGSFVAVQQGSTDMVTAASALEAFQGQVQEWKNLLLRGNDALAFGRHLKGFADRESQVRDRLGVLIGNFYSADRDTAQLDALMQEHAALGERYRLALNEFMVNEPESGKVVDASTSGYDSAFGESLEKLVHKLRDEQTADLQQSIAESTAQYGDARNILVAFIGVIVVVVAVLAAMIVRRVSGSVNELQLTMGRISRDWDLRTRVRVQGSDEIARTGESLNRMLTEFQQLVASLNTHASRIGTASAEVGSAMGRINQSAGVLNDSTATVAASIEELTVSINHVRENAERTQSITEESARLAAEGGSVIERTSGGMVETAATVREAAAKVEMLGEQSDRISDIVKVIREVADQTNLLALNAAIEAARAGEQGRGFAVVADEVRKLAERTSGATQEISTQIGEIQTSARVAVADMRRMVAEVNQDAELAQEAGGAIIRIRDGAGQVADVSAEIATALRQQAAASDTIASQVETIARSSDESAEAVGRTAAAVGDLEEMAREMSGAVARFTV